MAKQTGLAQRLYVGGANVSGDVTALDEVSGSVELLENTGIDKFAYERIGGLRDGKITCTSWFNPTVGAAHDVFAALPTSNVQVTYLTGTTIGAAAASMVAKQSNYATTRGDDGSLTAEIECVANGSGLEWGVLGTAGAVTISAATNYASLDNAALSTFGAQHYVHVLAYGSGTFDVKLQDSPDDATFTDVPGSTLTFTGTGAQRIATARGLSVARYLRVRAFNTFSAVTFVSVAVRNQTAVSF